MMLCMCWDDQERMQANGEAPGQCGTTGAAQMAQEAGVKRLVLVHIGPPLSTHGPMEKGIGDVRRLYSGEIIFADELMSLVDSVFQETSTAPRGPAPASGSPPGGAQIVVSPLFRNFSVDEMVAVIHGLKLLSFQRGDVIIRQGQPGASLFMLTSGRVRAFRKDPASGHQQRLGDLKEGAFFGEVSILTGKPRMASIVALTRCELLELDRPTLDEITRTQPHVWDVLREFAEVRARSAPS